MCEADYTKDSELDQIIKLVINKMAVTDKLEEISVRQHKEIGAELNGE